MSACACSKPADPKPGHVFRKASRETPPPRPFAAPPGRAARLFRFPLNAKDPPMTGFDRQTISDTTAKMLLEVQAVHFNAEKPYIFTSGWASPVYIDCRKLISYPRVRRGLMEMAEATILRDVGYEQIDAVAGGE